jgi:hypothetical protein
VLIEGLGLLQPEPAVLEAMVQGWERQQRVRFLKADALRRRRRLVQRLVEFSDLYPWQWTVPGRSAHGNVNASVIAKRLKDQAIHTRASRNAALIALAADLPASVLSDVFGISITSAPQWTRRASRDWNTYVAAIITERTTRSPTANTARFR